MALAIDITDGRGLSNEVRHELLLKKSKVCFFSTVNSCLTSCTLLTRQSVSILKMGVMCGFRSFLKKTGL